jgi:hypothetical protein
MKQPRTYEDYMRLCLLMKKVYNDNLMGELINELNKSPNGHYKIQLKYLIRAWDELGKQIGRKCYEETGKRLDC